MEVEISKDIDAPAEVVWHYLVDWERLGNWMKEASGFRVTSPHGEGVGVEADAIIRIGWLSTIDPIRVARWEPPDRAPRVGEGERGGALRSPAIRRPALVDRNADPTMGIGRETRNVALAAAHPPNLRAGSCCIEGGGRGRSLELASSGSTW